MAGNVRRRSDFNAGLDSVLSSDQMERLQKEIAELYEPEEREMPKVKDEMRKQIVQDLKKQKMNVKDDDIQGLLRMSAEEDIEIV